ncbi:MAG: hypothetical protein ACXVC6_14150 [Bacteroidia bacterium]
MKRIILVFLTIGPLISFSQSKAEEAEFRRLCGEVANAFAKNNMTSVNKFIEPSAGIYVITRPGAMDVVSHEPKLDEKKPFVVNYKDASSVKKHKISYGEVPKYSCGDMKWDKLAFVADSANKPKRLSDIMYFRSTNEGEKYTAAQTEAKDAVERKMRKVVYSSIAKKRGLVFYMSYLNGKWYLTVIDTTEGKCAA